MAKPLKNYYKVSKTKEGYKMNWFATRQTEFGNGVGLVDDNEQYLACENIVYVRGTCEFELLVNDKCTLKEYNLVRNAINSALCALDLETFLYNDNKRNEFINYALNGNISIKKIDILQSYIYTNVVTQSDDKQSTTHTLYSKRELIKDSQKVSDLIDENYGHQYAYFAELEIE